MTSAVGLLPSALQGIDTKAFLEGARVMDGLTRAGETRKNPAALLALAWYYAGDGQGDRAMVVLPYKDRLESLGGALSLYRKRTYPVKRIDDMPFLLLRFHLSRTLRESSGVD